MLKLPFFSELEQSKSILIAGAGGGYDVFCGLPLYFDLKSEGKEVYLANLSFSFLSPVGGERLSPSMLTVTADTPIHGDYFPERYLSEWFRKERNQEVPIYCFERTGVKPLLENYQALVDKLSLDTIVLVDGGTDSLMRGDEDELGTPHEDMASIAAVHELQIERKMLACLGLGVDHYHGVSNYLTFEAIADLTRSKGFLGMFSLLEDMLEVQMYREATEYVFSRMPDTVSIVSSSILSALAGHYGNHHSTSRTRGSKLWINPLMSVYWCFYLDNIAERILYLEEVKDTQDYMEIRGIISTFRQAINKKLRGTIPN